MTEVTMAVSPLPDFQPIHRSKLGVEFLCKDCHERVVWAESLRTGKTYLAVRVEIRNWETYRSIVTIQPSHKCVPTLEAQQRFLETKEFEANALADAVALGEIVKGQSVEVFKGRKIPIGTAGTVFWVANTPDRWGAISAGFTTAEGEKIFINIENLRVKGI